MATNFDDLMKQAQKMQESMQRAQEELGRMTIVGESGAGWVRVEMDGRHGVKKVTIDRLALDDKELLEDLVAAAVNDAVRKVEDESRKKIAALTSGIDLPT